MPDTEFKQGDTVYTIDGQMAEFVVQIGSQYMVRPCYATHSGDGETEYDPYPTDEAIMVSKVFQTPPSAVLDTNIAEKKKELDGLRSEISKARQEMRQQKSERDALLEKVAQVPELRDIAKLIDGQVTHLVRIEDGITIVEVKNANKNWRADEQVLTLTAQYGRGFRWVAYIGDFKRSCIACSSLEEAQKVALEQLDKMIVQSRTQELWLWQSEILQSCKNLDVPIPQEITDRIAAAHIAGAKKDIATYESKLAEANEKLALLTTEN